MRGVLTWGLLGASAFSALSIFLGCSLVTSLEGFSRGGVLTPEGGDGGGSAGGEEEAGDADAASDGARDEDAASDGASPDADATPAPCAAGAPAIAVRAFDATQPGTGAACNVDNALVEDGKVAGADRLSGNADGVIDGVAVNGCVAVEFGAPLEQVTVTLGPSGNACGGACDATSATGCGTGREFAIFVGPSRSDLRHVGPGTMTGGALARYSAAVPVGVSARVVVACRVAWSTARDDVAVDWIGGTCR
jgi:hypothetical protein